MPKKIKPELLAYCAGVIDSDGSIGIKYSNVKQNESAKCQEVITLKQVKTEAVKLFSKLFGGSIFHLKKEGNHQDQVGWIKTCGPAVQVVKLLLPYLKIKRKQAQNLVKLYNLKQKSRSSPRGPILMTPQINACIDKAYALNSVGRVDRRYARKSLNGKN